MLFLNVKAHRNRAYSHMKMCFTALSVWLLFKEFDYRVLHHHIIISPMCCFHPDSLFGKPIMLLATMWSQALLHEWNVSIVNIVSMYEAQLTEVTFKTALRNTKPSSFLSVNESEWPETLWNLRGGFCWNEWISFMKILHIVVNVTTFKIK